MPIEVASKRRKVTRPDALVVDVTSRGPDPWVRFSPFYPHGQIPVPMSPGVTSESVEGVWQALKVFESSDVDPSKLAVTSMKGLKRTVRRLGQVRGHRAGLTGDRLLDYRTARHEIYLPTYRWVLENRLRAEVARLRELTESAHVVLLDYTTNGDVDDLRTPLSHAALIVDHLSSSVEDTGRIYTAGLRLWGSAVAASNKELFKIVDGLAEAKRSSGQQYDTFRVRGKVFGYYWPRTQTVGLKQTLSEQQALVAERPDVFEEQFTSGGFGWVVVYLEGIEADELAELVFEAWRLSAPEDLVAQVPDLAR